MDDERIVEMYWNRDENAIKETDAKYGRYCRSISYNILRDHEDSRECSNDAYLEAWNCMPPQRPPILSAFLGMIVRRISIDRLRYKTAAKRGGGEATLSMDELEECVPEGMSMDEERSNAELGELLSDFLNGLPDTECDVFMRRYWYFDSIDDICRRFGFGRSKVKMMLFRTREKLRERLKKEGMFL